MTSRSLPSSRSLVFLVGAALVLGLVSTPMAVPMKERRSVEYAGCAAIYDSPDGRVCISVSGNALTVWVQARCSDVLVRENGELAYAETTTIQNGCQLRMIRPMRNADSTLSIEDGQAQKLIDRLQIRLSKTPFLERTKRAQGRNEVDLDSTIHNLRRETPIEPIDQLDVAFALGVGLARTGEDRNSLPYFRRVQEIAKGLGLHSIQIEAMICSAEILVRSGMVAEGEQAFSDIRSLINIKHSSNAELMLRFYDAEASLFRAKEAYQHAEQSWLSASLQAERVGASDALRASVTRRINVLAQLDRWTEIEKIVSQLDDFRKDAAVCSDALLLMNAGFAGLVLAEGRADAGTAPKLKIGTFYVRELLLASLEKMQRCRNDRFLAGIVQGLAWLNFFEGRTEDARYWLKRGLASTAKDAVTDMEFMDLAAQLAIADGEGGLAMTILDELAQRHSSSQSHFYSQFSCRIEASKLEAVMLLKGNYHALLERVRRCAAPSGGLAPSEQRWMARRLHALGL